MNTLQLYYECWVEVTKPHGPVLLPSGVGTTPAHTQTRYQDKWLSDETYYRAIKAQFPTLESLGFVRQRQDEQGNLYPWWYNTR